MSKNLLLEIKDQVALGPHTWAAAYVCRPKYVYAGTFLRTRLGFQKYEKSKFSTIMAEVWNESHIIWEPFQTPFFPLYKALHGTFSTDRKIPQEKSKIR